MKLPALLSFCALTLVARAAPVPANVIFVHPDGTSIGSWMATRFVHVGPDGQLNWDRMPHVAVYDGRLGDALSATSNSGATTHAWGVRASSKAFGLTGPGARSLSGHPGTLMQEAATAGRAVGIVQSGAHYEPGTAVFLTSAATREDDAGICAGVLASNAPVLLGGGEAWFLPVGTQGRHGEGKRTDGRNLVAEAGARGYAVVYTRAELQALPASTERVLGLFAHDHTFDDRTEEELRAAGKPLYAPDAPTVGEMLEAALLILARDPDGFFVVVEEEGSDNFANHNNAAGTIEAHWRADAALGVAQRFADAHDRTLVLTASDSSAGGMWPFGPARGKLDPEKPVPEREANGAPIDGRDGTATPPFLSAPDRDGIRYPFYVCWPSANDGSGGVVARAYGFNADRLFGNTSNVDLYRLMHFTLFGRELPAR